MPALVQADVMPEELEEIVAKAAEAESDLSGAGAELATNSALESADATEDSLTEVAETSIADESDTSVAAAKPIKASSSKRSKKALEVKPARTMELYASDKAAQLEYETNGSVLGFDNNRATASFLFTEKRDNLFSGGIMYDAQPEFLPGLTLSFGTKLYAALLGFENSDVVGLGGSIEGAYQIPVRQLPVKLSAAINYAPDILTFGQSDRIIDWSVRAGLTLTNNIEGFIGFRFLQFDIRPGNRELDDQVHLGIRWNLAD